MGRRNKKRKNRRLQFLLVCGALILQCLIFFKMQPEKDVAENEKPAEQIWLIRSMSREDLQQGDLVLVNYENVYDPTVAEELVGVYENKQEEYYVKSMDLTVSDRIMAPLDQWLQDYNKQTGDGGINIIAGHRSVQDQQDLYDNAVRNHGSEYAAQYFNKPGHSEHHTGLAVDFATWDQAAQTAGDFTGAGTQAWLLDNAWRYGFIQRYPPEKRGITGIAYESWHFRYVGIPHAWYMQQYGLVLEEYLELVRGYSAESPLSFRVDGDFYQVYYCRGLEVKLPLDGSFTISGDNMDGFIVTLLVE